MTSDGILTAADIFAIEKIMPCSITDGEQFEEGTPGIDDLEEERDETLNDTLRQIARLQTPGKIQ